MCRSQNRSHSDGSSGFTASLIYAALSALGVVWVVVNFLTAQNAEVSAESAKNAEVLRIA